MKCPKCGYNSFEYLDTCKKCKNDLSAFKEAHGIRSSVMPTLAAAAIPAAAAAATVAAAIAAPPAADDETFTWDEPPATAAPVPPPIKPGDDIFPTMDLDFAPTVAAAPAAPPPLSFDLEPTVAAASAAPPAEGEADLADFSFDEPALETTAAPAPPFGSAPVDDGFASLLETGDSSEVTAAAAAPAATPELESAWEAPANVFGGFDEEPNEPPAAVAQESGGFDLESFNWDEAAPKETPPPPKGPQVELDGFSPTEFDSLFGEPENR